MKEDTMKGDCTLVHTKKRRNSYKILIGKPVKQEPNKTPTNILCMCGCYNKINL
jgi:hypothetical protein